jgi:hypothetical protein
MTPSDDSLRRAFSELRESERAFAPALDTVLARQRKIQPRRMMPSVLVVALVASVITAVFVLRRPSRDSVSISISEWRAPTDVLLRTPGVEIISSVPSVRSSVLDGLAPPLP